MGAGIPHVDSLELRNELEQFRTQLQDTGRFANYRMVGARPVSHGVDWVITPRNWAGGTLERHTPAVSYETANISESLDNLYKRLGKSTSSNITSISRIELSGMDALILIDYQNRPPEWYRHVGGTVNQVRQLDLAGANPNSPKNILYWRLGSSGVDEVFSNQESKFNTFRHERITATAGEKIPGTRAGKTAITPAGEKEVAAELAAAEEAVLERQASKSAIQHSAHQVASKLLRIGGGMNVWAAVEAVPVIHEIATQLIRDHLASTDPEATKKAQAIYEYAIAHEHDRNNVFLP